ncbi:MAG: low molecular weight phosphotyrosine protein phosphatase [Clostridia bacterium]|nr:low molecular weight phosphotyrosine protein phosphatase [Clostridia bacterium]
MQTVFLQPHFSFYKPFRKRTNPNPSPIGIRFGFILYGATSTEEIWGDVGNPVYPPAKAELAKHGISCEGKRAVQLKKSDYDKYDLFVGMDSMNIRNMYRILGSDPEGKIRKLMEFTDRGGDVADPWYSGRFDVAWRDIYDGCEGLLESLAE